MKTFSLFLFLSVFFISGCNTTSDSYGNNFVTLKTLHGWCMPACVTEFTVTPNETYYKETNSPQGDERNYSARTTAENWNKIEFYLETTPYRSIETEPTCARCYDANDYVLIIQDGRFKNKIYYSWDVDIEEIEDFDAILREMLDEFLDDFIEAVPE